MIFGIDFDGTVVKHEYPSIGDPVPLAVETLLELQKEHALILYTMRSGKQLKQAVDYLTTKGVQLFGVNENRDQSSWTSSPKVYCHIYIDDAALGCPLIIDGEHREYVDWVKVREILDLKPIEEAKLAD